MISRSSETETPSSGLENWSWDAVKDDYVLAPSAMPEEAQEVIDEAGGKPPSELTAEEFARLYPPDTFRDNAAGIISFFGGTLAKYKSCEIDPGDVAFAKAMEVAYRRLLGSDNALVLKIMSSRDLVDLIIMSAWCGPFAKAVAAEGREKKKAKAMARPLKAENEPSPKAAKANNETVLGGGENV